MQSGALQPHISIYLHVSIITRLLIIDVLCADDGTKNALLKSPILLSLSPYARCYIKTAPWRCLEDGSSVINLPTVNDMIKMKRN